MDDRSIGTITMGPSFNLQGGYTFLILETGNMIHRREFTELPIPDNIIKHIEQLATLDGEDGNIIFTNRAGTEVADIPKSDEYKDWPAEANLTGVELQSFQDCQNIVDSYIQDDDEHNEPTYLDNNMKEDHELGHPPTQNEEADSELGHSPPQDDNINETQHDNEDEIETAIEF
eukprot:7049605-Ditylum_brightwellii.AAC.1